jgi:hypothetical protein
VKKPTERLLRAPGDDRDDAPTAADMPTKPSFGRNTQTPRPNHTELDFNALRGGDAAHTGANPRWMLPIAIVTFLGLLGGGWYFISTLLAFKTAILANQTSVLGPYPNFAVIFVIIPAFCGPFYFLIDYLGIKTGIRPFTSPQGIAATIALGIVLLTVSFLPVTLIRHKDNVFATEHGYGYCFSPFDPQRVHVYALRSYVDTYGCPTVNIQQQQ